MPSFAQPSPVLTGTVVEAGSERPLMGAEVTLRAVESPNVLRETSTDRDGTFQLADPPRGQYVLEVQLLGYTEHRRPVLLEAGESKDVTVTLSPSGASYESIVLSATRRPERALEVPASISVLTPEVIRQEGASSPIEALRPTAGVHVAQTGIDRRTLSLRGFAPPFSGSPHIRVDDRPAEFPLLGAHAFGPMSIMPHDLSRIEVVRGPATPLYGPEAGGGLVQFFTRDPFRAPGTSLSVAGGSQSFVDVQFRQAGVIGGTVGYKFTGQFSRADEWMLDSTNSKDAAEVSRYRRYSPNEPIPSGRLTKDRQLRRDDLYRTFNTNGRLTYRFPDDTQLSLRGGFASLTSPLQTGIGTLQANDLSYTYTQLQLDAAAFSASVGLNRNLDLGEAYRLDAGETVLNEGTRWTGQAQYDSGELGLNTQLLGGVDFDVTRPTTDASPFPQETVGRYGTYLQTTTEVAPPLTLTLGSRVDYNDLAKNTSFTPRATLVYDLASQHSLRAGYTRSVSHPGTDPLFVTGRFDVNPDASLTTQTIEFGYKGTFADRIRVHLDGYYEWKQNVLTPSRNGENRSYDIVERIHYSGLDASISVSPTETVSAFANVSLVTDDRFSGANDATPPVALNAPSSSIKGGIDYGWAAGFSVGVTAQYVDPFPVRWGPYVGNVDAYSLLDVRASYRLAPVPGLRIDVTAKNALDSDHREFVGAPAVGRQIIVRLTYELP
ncbi:hypothetical protein BSZ35_14280 [Salinibacter sp. 10B]|nr:hypothetical protein BSZ35_14280 [Salinibacter sp. 10B]